MLKTNREKRKRLGPSFDSVHTVHVLESFKRIDWFQTLTTPLRVHTLKSQDSGGGSKQNLDDDTGGRCVTKTLHTSYFNVKQLELEPLFPALIRLKGLKEG